MGDDIEKIAKHIQSKELVIASVTVGFEAGKEYKLEDGSSYIMPKGGHLVVIYGVDVNDGKVGQLLLHHPSSEEDYEWQNRIVSREEFLNSFSSKGNIIYFISELSKYQVNYVILIKDNITLIKFFINNLKII